ncbi:MAG: hypothetical protein CMJ18_18580 [Phycisphaeraceae bacterium]|nr:hypothetical protein [Phycisphaeraceae bacterium]
MTQWQSHVDRGVYPPRTYLLLDDLVTESQRGVELVAEMLEDITVDAPALQAEEDWEGVSIVCRCNCLLYDETEHCFKFWYACEDPRIAQNPESVYRRWAYATSPDGLNWQRPSLGLVEHGGSTANNIMKFTNVGPNVALLQNVVKDDRDPDPSRRYKSIGLDRHAMQDGEITWTGPDGEDEWYERMGRHIGCGLFVGFSPDGLSWTMKKGWAASGALIADGSVLHGFDARIGKWVMWQRPRILPKFRTVAMSLSDDFENWTYPVDIFAPDETDVPGIQFDCFASIEAPTRGYIGLVTISGYAGGGFQASNDLPELCYSRDGRAWQRIGYRPILDAAPDSWKNGPCALPLQPIVRGDEIFVFYYGKNRGKTWGEPTTDGKDVTRSALGLAKGRRDRWAGMRPKHFAGELTTRLVSIAHDELHVNADASDGSLRIEILDYENRPIEGFTLDDCDPITGDRLGHAVTWHGGADLKPIIGTARRQPKVGRGLKFRFVMEKAALFSFSC